MSSLTGNLISNSYQGLLKTSESVAISASLAPVTDGLGNKTAIYLSTNTLAVSSSLGATILTPNNFTVETADQLAGVYADIHGLQLFSGSRFLDITVDGTGFNTYVAGTLIAVSDNLGNPAAVAQFQNYDTWTDGTVTVNTPLQLGSGSRITGSLSVTGSTTLKGPVTVSGSTLISGSLKFSTSSSFSFPVIPPANPVAGTAYFSAGYLYIYSGTAYISASFK